MLPGKPDKGVGLVDGAIGIDPEIALQAARTGDEPGGAVVARPGVDLVELDHGVVTFLRRGGRRR
ncbi:hypothetical protein D3C71_2121540 [compost metagenome]